MTTSFFRPRSRKARRVSKCLVVFLILTLPGLAQTAMAEDWACKKDENWFDCFGRLSAEAAQQQGAIATSTKAYDKVRAETSRESREKAMNALTSLVTEGGAGTKRSFLPFLLAGLGAGGLEDDEGSLSLTLNPHTWSWGRLSGELVANKAELFSQLAEKISEAERETRVAALNDELSDFDDLKLSLRLVVRGTEGRIGRSLADYDPGFGTKLFSLIVPEPDPNLGKPVAHQQAMELSNKLQKTGANDETRGQTANRDERLAHDLDRFVAETAGATIAYSQSIQNSLTRAGFFALADLASNQPQLYFTGELKTREDLVGPDTWSLGATFELGIGANLNKLRRTCRGKEGAAFVGCYTKFAEDAKDDLARQERFKLEVSFGETEAYESPLDDVDLSLERAKRIKATVGYGRILRHNSAGKESSRLDVEATYEDVSNDDNFNDRLVAVATFTERLTDDLAFSISAVWANKPEYLGDVDEELSTRAGLRYKIGSLSD